MPTDSTTNHHNASEYKSTSSEPSRILRIGLTVSLIACFLIGFFSFYFCRYKVGARRNRRRNSNEASFRPQILEPSSGLDPCIIATFPILTYSWVKSLQEGRYGQECAICLGEFGNDDVLRLITACSHVFHIGCIDLWLKSHMTCPVCRRELNPQEESREVRIVVSVADEQGVVEGARGDEDMQQQQQQRRISFKEEDGAGDGSYGTNAEEERRRTSGDLDRLPRSNSTGHSSRWREDRYILRLPEDIKERISRERNWTGSCINLRELLGNHIKDDVDFERSGFSDRVPSRT